MPLVPPSNATIVKVSLPDRIVHELTDYAEWANTTKARVIRIALERLFEADTEWPEYTPKKAVAGAGRGKAKG